jgi:hypothetical protein
LSAHAKISSSFLLLSLLWSFDSVFSLGRGISLAGSGSGTGTFVSISIF